MGCGELKYSSQILLHVQNHALVKKKAHKRSHKIGRRITIIYLRTSTNAILLSEENLALSKYFLAVGSIEGVAGSKCQVPLPARGLLVNSNVEQAARN